MSGRMPDIPLHRPFYTMSDSRVTSGFDDFSSATMRDLEHLATQCRPQELSRLLRTTVMPDLRLSLDCPCQRVWENMCGDTEITSYFTPQPSTSPWGMTVARRPWVSVCNTSPTDTPDTCKRCLAGGARHTPPMRSVQAQPGPKRPGTNMGVELLRGKVGRTSEMIVEGRKATALTSADVSSTHHDFVPLGKKSLAMRGARRRYADEWKHTTEERLRIVQMGLDCSSCPLACRQCSRVADK